MQREPGHQSHLICVVSVSNAPNASRYHQAQGHLAYSLLLFFPQFLSSLFSFSIPSFASPEPNIAAKDQ